MSTPPAEDDKTGEPEQPRDKKGRFGQKTQTDSSDETQPKTSDYTKMNSILAKQLGIEGKLADFQTQYEPEALFKQLSFMADNTDKKAGTPSSGLPDNKPIAPISPPQPKNELPGKQISTPNLTQEKFAVHFEIDPRTLFQPKKEKK